MTKTILIVLFLQPVFLRTYAQLDTYFHKIEFLANNERSATNLYKRLDSLKLTRRPTDSKIAIYFNRDVDFGYKHERIHITFNGMNYQINMLTKNDSIYFSSVLYGITSFMNDFEYQLNKRQNHPKIDTVGALKYLSLRNSFYYSAKTISDLKTELNLDGEFSLSCGDGNLETDEFRNLKKLVKEKNIKPFLERLKSISCEEQAYGALGINMLRKSGYKIPKNINKIVGYLRNRKSPLVGCNGCFILVK